MSTPIIIKGIRKRIATKMSQSWQIIPKVDYEIELNVSEIYRLKNNFKMNNNINIQFLPFMIKLCSVTLNDFPLLNASVDDKMINIHNEINIGFAINTEYGLFVPNIKNANKKTIYAIANEFVEIIKKANSHQLNLMDMSNGTFTISNLGSYGIKRFNPIINYPEVAIIGIGSKSDDDIVSLNLSADHRIIDGVYAANFLKKLKENSVNENIY